MQIARTGTTPNVYQYSGEWLDPNLSFYNLRARYYNQATGRFETMDPYAGSIVDPGTLHKYAYAQNNPVGRIDPTGKDAEEEVVLYHEVTLTATPEAMHLAWRTAQVACTAAGAFQLGWWVGDLFTGAG